MAWLGNPRQVRASFTEGDSEAFAITIGLRQQVGEGVLKVVLHPNGTVDTENGADEKVLKPGGLRLGDNKKRHTKNDTSEAHAHSAFFGDQKPPGDLQVQFQLRAFDWVRIRSPARKSL